MRLTATLLILTRILEKPYFTSKEARDLGVRPAILSYYVSTGLLKRVRRGLYQKMDYQNSLSFRWDDLIESVYSVKGSVVCLTSALAIYDLTEEIPRQHWLAIRHGTSAKTTQGIKVLRYRNMKLGKTEIKLEGTKMVLGKNWGTLS